LADHADWLSAVPVGRGRGHDVSAVAVGRAGGREVIIAGNEDRTVRVWDAGTGQPLVQQQFPDAIASLALVGERLITALGNDVVVLRVNPAILPVTGMSARQEGVS